MRIQIGSDPEIVLEHQFSNKVSPSTIARAFKGGHVHKGGFRYTYTIRPALPHQTAKTLWIQSKKISLKGSIKIIHGSANGWDLGIIQTIYKSERNGYYEGGVERLFKLDTSFGPLKDGQDSLFYRTCTAIVGASAEINDDDEPSFELPVTYRDQNLKKTSGSDAFCSFLAMKRESDKSVILLESVPWTVNWTGTYNFAKEEWTPADDRNMFIAEGPYPQEKVYPRLKFAQPPPPLPFSARCAEAESFAKILQDGEWKPCDLRGNTDGAGRISLKSWVNA